MGFNLVSNEIVLKGVVAFLLALVLLIRFRKETGPQSVIISLVVVVAFILSFVTPL